MLLLLCDTPQFLTIDTVFSVSENGVVRLGIPGSTGGASEVLSLADDTLKLGDSKTSNTDILLDRCRDALSVWSNAIHTRV